MSLDAQFARFGSYNMVLPKEGPKVIPQNLDFRTVDNQLVDLSLAKEQGFVTFISSLYIDNRANTGWFKISSSGIQQEIQIAAGAQAYMPMLVSDTLQFETSVEAVTADCIVPVFFLNFPVNPIIF